MSKLKEEELLEKLNKAFEYLPLSIANGQARRQIKEMIQKPGVTKEWIEEKARELLFLFYAKGSTQENEESTAKDFIRSLVEEIHGRK